MGGIGEENFDGCMVNNTRKVFVYDHDWCTLKTTHKVARTSYVLKTSAYSGLALEFYYRELFSHKFF